MDIAPPVLLADENGESPLMLLLLLLFMLLLLQLLFESFSLETMDDSPSLLKLSGSCLSLSLCSIAFIVLFILFVMDLSSDEEDVVEEEVLQSPPVVLLAVRFELDEVV